MSELPDWLSETCRVPDSAMADAALARQQQLTKPLGALGELERLAVRLAALQGRPLPQIEQVQITVFAADHGIAREGVSAYPQAVTAQMVANFASGGAAVAVLARRLAAGFEVVNLGTAAPVPAVAGVVERIIAAGTKNFCTAPAMDKSQLHQALSVGAERVAAANEKGLDLFVAGEMGIGNTSSATAIAAVLTGLPLDRLVGPGTGLSAQGVSHKAAMLSQALQRHQPDAADPLSLLQLLGGFEIAAMTGAYIRCAQLGVPVLVDGFISTAAALVAVHYQPAVASWLIYGHCSAEPGHRLVLAALEAQPLLQLGMRLGEGSGAALAVDILRAACRLHAEMATFAEAGVAGREM